jgi:hypothetical protein
MVGDNLVLGDILIRGTASEVLGMNSETAFRNTVRDSKMVTSAIGRK